MRNLPFPNIIIMLGLPAISAGIFGMPSLPIVICIGILPPPATPPPVADGGGMGGEKADGPPVESLEAPSLAGSLAAVTAGSSTDSFILGPPLPTTSAYIGTSLVE